MKQDVLSRIYDQYPAPDLEALSLVVLADLLLKVFVEWEVGAMSNHVSRTNFPLARVHEQVPPRDRAQVLRLWMEAFQWLEREGMIAPHPGAEHLRFVTRRGHEAAQGDVETYLRTQLLPRERLHARLATLVFAPFAQGRYDTVIFEAVREVEIAVREASGLGEGFYGTDLMRRAFHPETGPLRDPQLPAGEREGMGHMFAGAIALYKNPGSHRHAGFSGEEAADVVVMASHLLRIVDSRREATT